MSFQDFLLKFQDICDDENVTVNTQELAKIINNLVKTTLKTLDNRIIQTSEQPDVEAEIVDSDKTTREVNVGAIQHNAKKSDSILHSQSSKRVMLKTTINPVGA